MIALPGKISEIATHQSLQQGRDAAGVPISVDLCSPCVAQGGLFVEARKYAVEQGISHGLGVLKGEQGCAYLLEPFHGSRTVLAVVEMGRHAGCLRKRQGTGSVLSQYI